MTLANAGMDDGLVAHYPLNGTAANRRGGASGVVYGGASFASGDHGIALSLSKEGDYVSISPSEGIDLAGESRTISVWFKPGRQLHSQNAILDKTRISDYDLVVLTNADPNLLKIRFRAHDGTKFRAISGMIPASQRINAVIVKSGTNFGLYTNGKLVGTISVNAVLTKNKPLIVGAGGSPYTPGYGFTGNIQELRFYDRALTEEEVRALFTSFCPMPPMASTTALFPVPPVPPSAPTTPTVPTAPVRSTVSLTKEAGLNEMVISWTATIGSSYRVQYKEDISAPTWNTLSAAIIATSESMAYTDSTNDSSSNRFYRVVLLP